MVIEEIISLIDQELEKKGKQYISVQALNKLIKAAGFNEENLSNPGSKLIKDGKIPHAFKFPKSNQWSIPHSNPEKVKNIRKCSECKFFYAVDNTLKITKSQFGPYHHYVICPHCKKKTGVPYYYADIIKGKKNGIQKGSTNTKNINIQKPKIKEKPSSNISSNQKQIPWYFNKRNNKYVYWGIGVLIIISLIISDFINTDQSPPNPNPRVKSQNSNLVTQLNQKYMGSTYNIDLGELFINKYGYPESLNGTNNFIWVAYFPKGNFTMTQTKGDHKIVKFETGRKPRNGY